MASIEIDGDAVNKVVAEAILNSGLGAHLRALATEHLKTLHSSYNNPIKAALEKETYRVVEKLVQDEFRPKIEELVREQLTDEIISTCAAAAWKTLLEAINRNKY